MRTLYGLILLLLAVRALAEPLNCGSQSPTEVAVGLYQDHRNFIHSGSMQAPLSASLQSLVMANFSQNLQAGDVGAIDWDFWTDAQDGDVSQQVRASLVSRRRDAAIVRLRYHFVHLPESKPQAKFTDVHLQRSSTGCWLADDLVHNQISLSALLRRGIKKAGEPE